MTTSEDKDVQKAFTGSNGPRTSVLNLSKTMQRKTLSPNNFNANIVNELEMSKAKLIRKNSKKMETTINLENALKNHYIFSDFKDNRIISLVKEIPFYSIDSKTYIITEKTVGDFFYIIEEGSFDVYCNNVYQRTLNEGECFGELGLLYNCQREMSVISTKKSFIYVINGIVFEKLLEELQTSQYTEIISFLNSYKHTSVLNIDQKTNITKYQTKMIYKPGQLIFSEGDVANSIYWIKEGEVDIKSKDKVIRTLKKHDFFGDISILLNTTRTKSAYAKTKCVFFTISRANYTQFMCSGKVRDTILAFHIRIITSNSEVFRKFNIKNLLNSMNIFTIKTFKKGEIVLTEDYDLSSKIIFCICGRIFNVIFI